MLVRVRCREEIAASAVQKAAAFAFGDAAPDAVLHVVGERVFRHSTRTGQSAQMCCAVSTPRLADGKNSVGARPRQRASIIQAFGSMVSSCS